jgi:hypothetical protein
MMLAGKDTQSLSPFNIKRSCKIKIRGNQRMILGIGQINLKKCTFDHLSIIWMQISLWETSGQLMILLTNRLAFNNNIQMGSYILLGLTQVWILTESVIKILVYHFSWHLLDLVALRITTSLYTELMMRTTLSIIKQAKVNLSKEWQQSRRT